MRLNQTDFYGLNTKAQAKTGIGSRGGSAKGDAIIAIGSRIYGNLAEANDEGVPFSDIADWIEANYEKL